MPPKLVADVYGYTTGKEKRLARFLFDGKGVKATPDSSKTLLAEIVTMGVSGYKGKLFFPEDGEDFMRALPLQYRGGSMSAQVREVD